MGGSNSWEVVQAGLCILGILIIWLVADMLTGSAISPIGLLASVWITITLPCWLMTSVFETSRVSSSGYWLILVFVMFAFLGGILGHTAGGGATRKQRNLTPGEFRHLAGVYRIVALLFLAETILSVMYYVQSYGTRNLFELAAAIAGTRYVEDIREPAIISLLHVTRFAAPAIHGFICADERRWGYWRSCYLWLIPLAVVTLVFSSRSQFLFSVAYWMAGYISGAGYFGSATKWRCRQICVGSLLFVIASVPFAYGLYTVRWGFAAPEQVNWARPAMAVFGVPFTMGEWVDGGGLGRLDNEFKLKSLNSLSRTLGIQRELIPGIYPDIVSVTFGEEEAESNIYSTFRPLLDDLGVSGALISVMLGSFLGAYGWLLVRGGYLIGLPLVFWFTAWALWSPVTSAYAYNANIVASALVPTIWIVVLSHKRRNVLFGHKAG